MSAIVKLAVECLVCVCALNTGRTPACGETSTNILRQIAASISRIIQTRLVFHQRVILRNDKKAMFFHAMVTVYISKQLVITGGCKRRARLLLRELTRSFRREPRRR